MYSGKILSVSDCTEIEEQLQKFNELITEYFEELSNGISTFNNNEIVQSFYASGKFGNEMQEELKKIFDAVRKYYDSLASDSGLIKVTSNVIQSQRDNLSRSYFGGGN